MDLSTIQAAADELAKHLPFLVGLAFLAWLMWKVVQLVFWSEKRVERIASQVLSSEPVRKGMRDLAAEVFGQLIEKEREQRLLMEGRMRAIEERDAERAESVKRAHVRLDTLGDKIGEVYAMVAGLKR